MALLAPTVVSGSAFPTLTAVAAASGGDTVTYKSHRRQVLIVNNGGAAACTVTITAQRTSIRNGEDVYSRANISQAVAAGAVRYFPITEAFTDANGLVNVGYSQVSSVTVGVLELDF